MSGDIERKGGPIKPEPLARGDIQTNDAVWLFNQIWQRINQRNEHFVAALVGREGAGKSWTAAKIAECIDPEFDADKILFKLDNFLEVLAEEEYSSGDVYVLDEAGVSLGNRTWQDRAQVLGNQALQLIRDHNIGLIFTLPRVSELDKQARGRLQLTFEIVSKQEGEHVTAKPKRIDPDRSGQTGEIYQKWPRRVRNRGGVVSKDKIKRIRITPPSDDVIDGYQAKKDEFQTDQYERAIAKLRGEDPNADDDELDSPSEIADDILEHERIDEFIQTHNNGSQRVLSWQLLANDYDIGKSVAKRTKSELMARRDIDAM